MVLWRPSHTEREREREREGGGGRGGGKEREGREGRGRGMEGGERECVCVRACLLACLRVFVVFLLFFFLGGVFLFWLWPQTAHLLFTASMLCCERPANSWTEYSPPCSKSILLHLISLQDEVQKGEHGGMKSTPGQSSTCFWHHSLNKVTRDSAETRGRSVPLHYVGGVHLLPLTDILACVCAYLRITGCVEWEKKTRGWGWGWGWGGGGAWQK